jgi:hypothetical protein
MAREPTLSDRRTRLIPLLIRLDAPDLASKLWSVRDVRELSPDVRGEILDMLGHEAATRGLGRDETPNQLGRELDAMAQAVLDDTPS